MNLRNKTTNLIVETMASGKINRSTLGRRMGFTRAYVTQILGKNSNITLDKVDEIFVALGYQVDIVLRKIPWNGGI